MRFVVCPPPLLKILAKFMFKTLQTLILLATQLVRLLSPGYQNLNNNWNDRRSRRVFFCFYSAIFQLTSARFQTFAYNSRTVGSSNMKFGQQFEINELYV